MKKILYIFIVFGLICFACQSNKKDDAKYKYMYGKWKYEGLNEIWIDKNYVFFGSPDFPIICNYYIKSDSIFCYLKKRNQILMREPLPRQLGADTIILGHHITRNLEKEPTKYYRVRNDIPNIDTNNNWQKKALLEIVNYYYDGK